MDSSSLLELDRDQRIDEIAEALPQRVAVLSRLFLARAGVRASRTEIGVLRTLCEGPCRITELAAHEGVTQPGITLLVNRLVERGWASRSSDPSDARAVLVALTPTGRASWERLRAEYRALLHEEMATLPDGDVAALARSIDVLDLLIAKLRGDES